jgi:phenylpyruvate tautomerase PptA (4-oxalocrotonate tautomerase family)
VKILLEATNKHNFIKGLTEIVADAENKDNIKEIASVINAMPSDNVPYFLTLIRFHYASINNVK